MALDFRDLGIVEEGRARLMSGRKNGVVVRMPQAGSDGFPVISMTGSNKMSNLLARPSTQKLACVKALLEAGNVVAVIDRCYP